MHPVRPTGNPQRQDACVMVRSAPGCPGIRELVPGASRWLRFTHRQLGASRQTEPTLGNVGVRLCCWIWGRFRASCLVDRAGHGVARARNLEILTVPIPPSSLTTVGLCSRLLVRPRVWASLFRDGFASSASVSPGRKRPSSKMAESAISAYSARHYHTS